MTDNRDDGGPALPVAVNGDTTAGMSLRDYFAGQALIGLLAGATGAATAELFAAEAYLCADAMIQERKK